MRFQTKLFFFFAVTVVAPIAVATLVASLMFLALTEDEVRDRQRDRLTTANALLEYDLQLEYSMHVVVEGSVDSED